MAWEQSRAFSRVTISAARLYNTGNQVMFPLLAFTGHVEIPLTACIGFGQAFQSQSIRDARAERRRRYPHLSVV